MADKSWQSVKKLNAGKRGSRIEAYYAIGKALIKAVPPDRVSSYGNELVTVFITEWERLGGFPLCLTTAKYARRVAVTFTPQMLHKALADGLSWTEVRELSANNPVAARKRRRLGKSRRIMP